MTIISNIIKLYLPLASNFLETESWKEKSLKAATEVIGHLQWIATACSVVEPKEANVQHCEKNVVSVPTLWYPVTFSLELFY